MTFRQLLAKVQAECPEKLYRLSVSLAIKTSLFVAPANLKRAASDLRDSKSDPPESMMGEATPELTAKSYSKVIQELLRSLVPGPIGIPSSSG